MRVTWENRRLRIQTEVLPPIALHWSAFVGALLFGRGTIGGALGFVALILLHEIGHAMLVRARRLHALEIVVHAFGGACHYAPGWGTAYDHAIIAWGGIVAQTAALALALAIGRTFRPGLGIVSDVLFVFIVPNLLMIVLNLLPIPGLDGALAWKLPGMLFERARRRRLERRHDALRRELAAIERRRNLH